MANQGSKRVHMSFNKNHTYCNKKGKSKGNVTVNANLVTCRNCITQMEAETRKQAALRYSEAVGQVEVIEPIHKKGEYEAKHPGEIDLSKLDPTLFPAVRNNAFRIKQRLYEWQEENHESWVMTLRPTESVYKGIQAAYDFFNIVLFSEQLPDCAATVEQRERTKGYYHPDKWTNKETGEIKDQITLNPYFFAGQENPEKDVLASLVHEMIHQYRERWRDPRTGQVKPPRRNYHDQVFGRMSLALGLKVIAVDKQGNPIEDNQGRTKMTGQSVGHKIIKGGAFDLASEFLLSCGWRLMWADTVNMHPEQRPKAKKNKSNREKYVCSICDGAVWGRPNLVPICGGCLSDMLNQNPQMAAKVIPGLKPFMMANEDASNIPR